MGSCISCAYNCCCCQYNCIIFPSPFPSYTHDEMIKQFTNIHGDIVPYLHMKNNNATHHIIYFHGNAEDIGYSASFLQPILIQLSNVDIYAVQYPTYGIYHKNLKINISNRIKTDALQFYQHLKKDSNGNINQNNTIVMGRSIGSGGACYLASQKQIKNLAIISPFSTIPNVANDMVGCVGKLIKTHFDNLQEIQKYQGRLLVIHGRVDEVISYRHGRLVVNTYQANKAKNKCTFISPYNMSHNYFNYEVDILKPICQFVRGIKQ